MTSQQILNADLLDILFEHRNKLYGAYELRKTYSRQMLKALGFAIIPVFLLFLFANPSEGNNATSKERERVVVVEQFVLPKEEKKPEPKVLETPKTEIVKQQKFIDNIVVKEEVVDPLPPQELLATTAVSNTTVTEGSNASTFQPPVAPEESEGNGTEVEKKEEPREVKPDRQPQFPGGMQAWLAFLGRHLQSPAELESGEKRTVLIRFHVAEDGSVTNFAVLQSAGEAFDKEVMRVLRKMPKWTPAMQAGNPVPVSFTQPVTFVGLEE